MSGSNNIEKNSDLLRIATCGRAVGLKGEIALWPISNIEERYRVGSIFFTDDNTELIINTIREHKDHYIVRFEGKSSREDIENLVNEVLYAPALEMEILDDGEFFAHDVIGKTLIDQNGIDRGKVTSFIENAASDLMETQDGNLVPFTFINRIEGDSIHIEAPDGLFEINDGE